MTTDPAGLLGLGVARTAPFLVWSATGSGPDTARALATRCAEIFLTVMAYTVARFVALPGLHWLEMLLR